MAFSVAFVNAPHHGNRFRQYYLEVDWTDSIDPNAVSVNVYRSTVSGGPYTLIANVPNGVQLYSDFGVVPQTTYFYVLTEVNNLSQESAQSAEQSGTPGFIP